MKSQDSQEKKFRQLSDQELEKVTGGAKILGAGIPEECKDEQYMCSHPEVCKKFCASVS